MATIDKSKPSIFGNINAYFRPMFSKEKVPTYNEMEDHVPIVDIYDRFLIDKYGCVSALYMIDAPAADVASADQLTLIQNQLCSMIDNLPESILQLQFIFATAGSYKDLILKHASYESVFPIANSIRKKTAELLIEESRNRRVVKNSTILALSCAPKTIGAGGVLSEFKIDGKTGQTTIPAKAITKTQCMESISTLETSEGLIEDCFGRVGITARPMTASEIAEYFYLETFFT